MDRAIFTSIAREPYFDLWLRYYKKFFKDIFVLRMFIDPDPCIEEAKLKHKFIEILDYKSIGMNYERESEAMSEFQNKLIKDYDCVVYAQGDEFLVANPDKYKNLGEFLDQNKNYKYHCSGWNVCHLKEEEPPLNLSKTILKQRKYWIYEFGYNKPAITRVPIRYHWGMHKLWDMGDGELHKYKDSDVRLVHLKQADYHIFIKRLKENNNMDWFSKRMEEKELIPDKWKETF